MANRYPHLGDGRPIDLFTPARFAAEGENRRHLVAASGSADIPPVSARIRRDEDQSERRILAGTVMDGLDPDDVWTEDGDVLRAQDNRSADRA